MPERANHRAWVEIDRSTLKHNVEVLRALLPQACRLMPAVKGDGYGLGAVAISRELNRLGVQSFCVATLEEGIELRESGIQGEILVLGYTHPDGADELKKHDLTQTAVDAAHARKLAAAKRDLPVHLKLDTGMHRLGVHAERWAELAELFALEGLSIRGLYTQLGCCDSTDPASITYTQSQLAAFDAAVAKTRSAGASPAPHAQCSYGILNYPGLPYAYARPGLALYGIVEQDRCRDKMPPLKPIFTVKTRVALVKAIQAGECVGYDRAYVAARDMRMAVVTAGYADGLPRSLSCGAGQVLVRGRRAPIIGNICMDQAMIDVTGIAGAVPGDEVTLIGGDGDSRISVHDVARWAKTIPNEIVSRLGRRVSRSWL